MAMSREELLRRLQGVQEPLRSIAISIWEQSGGKIGVTGHGGFRSREQQQRMYDDYLAGGNLAAKPGYSMHERGLAIDFDTDDYDLLAQLATQHGLVNSVDGEPWHYTMGDDVEMTGADSTPGLAYDIGQTENPEDALANRLNAMFSILGGSSAAGMESTGALTPATSQLMMDEADPSTIASAAGASALTGNAMGQYALQAFSQYGWGPQELQALTVLWNRESGDPGAANITWNPAADNPTSSAAGIAQKMTSIHGPLEPSWQGQIDWGLGYIADRYGSPSAALRFHDRNNWY